MDNNLVSIIVLSYKNLEYIKETLDSIIMQNYNNIELIIGDDGTEQFNEDIYICEYLPDGLTANFYSRRVESIMSTCESYNILSSLNLPYKYKLRYKINYYRYGLNRYTISNLNKNLYKKELKIISIFIGYLMYLKDKKE